MTISATSNRTTFDWMRMLAIVALMLGSAACSTDASDSLDPSTQPSQTQTDSLALAVAHWDAANIDRYLVRAIDTDQTPTDGGCTWITEVHGEEVDMRSTAQFDVECGVWDVSVPAMHEQIATFAAEVDRDGGSFDVEWAAFGVPSSIDFSSTSGDRTSVVVEFHRLDRAPSTRLELASARTRWARADISSYRLEVTELQNYWSNGCRWTTEVAAEIVVEADVASETNSNCSKAEWTVESLFDRVASMADGIDNNDNSEFDEHTLVVTFDDYGVPATIRFDLTNGADEESDLQVSFSPVLD